MRELSSAQRHAPSHEGVQTRLFCAKSCAATSGPNCSICRSLMMSHFAARASSARRRARKHAWSARCLRLFASEICGGSCAMRCAMNLRTSCFF
eukprot:2579496-Rhodomonas_salina.1